MRYPDPGVAWGFRQLWDEKGSVVIEWMKLRELPTYAELCGWMLARAHARSRDAAALTRYLGSGAAIDKALADFAELYADQNEVDCAALDAAVKSGRVKAQEGQLGQTRRPDAVTRSG